MEYQSVVFPDDPSVINSLPQDINISEDTPINQ